MVHHRQGLLLGVEPSEHILRTLFRLDELEGNSTLDWLVLLGQPDDSHSATADFFNQAKIGQDRRNVDRQRNRLIVGVVRRGIASKHAGDDTVLFRESLEVFVPLRFISLFRAIFHFHGQQFCQQSLPSGLRCFCQKRLNARSVSVH